MWVRGLLLIIAIVSLLTGCSGDPGTGAKEVKWDRDACERCRMVLSDRAFSVQVRYLPEGKKFSKVLFFDDIGCATLWLEDKPWKDNPKTEIWVTDHRSGEWIDARSATYVKDKMTPMAYGLGAQSEPAEGGLSYEQAKKHVRDVEERHNLHSAHLLEKFKEQARKRMGSKKSNEGS